jgi:antitoxin component YwqK of YwqJK toxin-antitoxin module
MTMLHNNELLVKYLSYAPVYKIKRRKVSDNFRDIILNLFDTNEMNYQLGKKHGKWTYFYPHGVEARLESWTMGVKDGEFRTNNEKGEILTQEFFKKGIPDGTHIVNFPNGKPRHITVYEKGQVAEEHEFEELTGAKHTIKERVLKEKDKKKLDKNATVIDDDPDDLLGEKAAKKAAEEAAKEATKNKKNNKKKKTKN